MFTHPVAIMGYFAIVAGAVAALMASGMDYRDAGATLLIGNALLGIGGFMVLLGVIAQGFLRIEKHLSGVPEMKAAFDAHEQSQIVAGPYVKADERPMIPLSDGAEQLRREAQAKGVHL